MSSMRQDDTSEELLLVV